MIIGTSEARALIKANIRKLREGFDSYMPEPRTGKASRWMRHMIKVSDAICGVDNLLQHKEDRHPRTKKLQHITRHYLWYREDGSADILHMTLDVRKRTYVADIHPVHITNHALIRMTADQLDMNKSVLSMAMAILVLLNDCIWPLGESVCLYVNEGMYALVKTTENETGVEIVVVKTFIRADKFDAGSEHEKMYSELDDDSFAFNPPMADKPESPG